MHDMWFVVLVLGVVEGLTEFLPISSTGHLILAGHAIGFEGRRAEAFQIFIQLGAILAVVWEYRGRLAPIVTRLGAQSPERTFGLKIAAAFVPSAAVGLLVHDQISAYLFGPLTVALALVAGAVLILVVEAMPLALEVPRAEGASWRQAIVIGVFQCLALWPGFSRSAATILGGLLAGLDRKAATEFSFFLAVPTMVAASAYDLAKNHDALVPGDGAWLAICFALSFLVAWASVRWLLRFVSSHTFRPFAWYRLAVGTAILAFLV